MIAHGHAPRFLRHPLSLLVRALAVGGVMFGVGCSTFRPMIADDQDASDYRKFRTAAHEGRRLGYADDYLAAHPKGAFAEEVRTTFQAEEEAYFERAKASRQAAREYYEFLPRGPHAEQAISLITAFDTDLEEKALLEVVRRVRYNEATLEVAASARRRVGETVLAAIGALSDDNVYGARIQDAPDSVHRVLAPPFDVTRVGIMTWGFFPTSQETDLFFLLPTRPERESRVATIKVELLRDEAARIRGGMISGEDLFVRWQEADLIAALDPTQISDRTEAGIHALEILGGALEARFPRETCSVPPPEGALYARACRGLSVSVVMGESAGAVDRIVFTTDKKR